MEKFQMLMEGTFYRNFKAQCALENTTMSEVARSLIQQWLDERIGKEPRVKVIRPIQRS